MKKVDFNQLSHIISAQIGAPALKYGRSWKYGLWYDYYYGSKNLLSLSLFPSCYLSLLPGRENNVIYANFLFFTNLLAHTKLIFFQNFSSIALGIMDLFLSILVNDYF